jgi:hypothetical protein
MRIGSSTMSNGCGCSTITSGNRAGTDSSAVQV